MTVADQARAPVELSRRDRVAVVTLSDPDRRNAFTDPMIDALRDIFDEIEADEGIGAVVITGAGSAFCGGADLGALESADAAGLRHLYEGFLRVARCPLPTIAAVNGAAIGAGFNLALSCDVRIAAESARFVPRFLEIGLHPGGGHTWMLARAVGPERALAMLLFGEETIGESAVTSGLALRCVAQDRVLDESVALASRAAALPRALTMRVKQTLSAMAAIDTRDDAVDLELDAQAWSVAQPSFRERLAALRAGIARGGAKGG
jgi:enoyl-CoA hydratase